MQRMVILQLPLLLLYLCLFYYYLFFFPSLLRLPGGGCAAFPARMAHGGHSPLEVREGGGGDVNKNFSRLGSPLRPFIPRINDCGSGPAPCPARRERRGRPGAPRGSGGQRGLGGGSAGPGSAVGSGGAAGAERCAGPGWRCPGAWRLPAPACPPLPPPFPSLPTAGLSPPPSPAAPRRWIPGLPGPQATPLPPPPPLHGITRKHPASPRAAPLPLRSSATCPLPRLPPASFGEAAALLPLPHLPSRFPVRMRGWERPPGCPALGVGAASWKLGSAAKAGGCWIVNIGRN